ncbi:MAG: branched-chain amino acid ABC transporter permease [Epsilonproteobacteria bacterium]|nr:branched-chain amino acid ABC transporter permease [Campylobacterota bacterium]
MAIKCGIFKTSYMSDMAIWQTKNSRFWMTLFFISLAVFPFFVSKYFLYMANIIAIGVIAAVGLNILTGFAGQISLGHGAFIGVGAYFAGYLTSQFNINFIPAFIAGGLVTAVVGMFFGLPSLRLKGFYLAIATMAAQFILAFVFIHLRSVTGGSQGMIVSPPEIAGFSFDSDFRYYFLSIGTAIVMTLAAKNLIRGKFGRAFMAIRDNYIAAKTMGVNIFLYKIIAFGISSFYAGIAGALWAHYIQIITPEHFTFSVSIEYLAIIIIGGLGSLLGTVFGTIFIMVLPEFLRFINGIVSLHYPMLVNMFDAIREGSFGLAIIGFLIFEPDGLAARWKTIKNYWKLWPFSY